MSTPIEFDDIREGDRIKTVRSYPEVFGRKRSSVWEGVANHKDDDGDWCTSEGIELTYLDAEATQTFYLIDRPKPPLPTEPGTVFRATKVRGVECDVVVFVRLAIVIGLVYVTSDFVGGFFDHHPTHITEWEEI